MQGDHAKGGDSNDGWQRYKVRQDLGDGLVLGITLIFFNARLVKVRFDYRSETECGWSNWSEKLELIRTDNYQCEIIRQLGRRGRFAWGWLTPDTMTRRRAPFFSSITIDLCHYHLA